MKKILMIGAFPNPITGLSIANETLYEGLSKKYKVNKINTTKDDSFVDKKDIGKFKFSKFFKIIKNLISEMKIILSENYDVVYMTPGQSYLGFMRFAPYMLCTIVKKKPYYIHIHGGFIRKMYDSQSKLKKKSIDFFLKRLEGVIVLGDSLRAMFKNLVPEEKIFVCENGVQDEFIATESEIKEKLKRMEKDTKQRILYLSNLMEEKGILDLLKVSESFTDDEIEFNLAGAMEPSIKHIVKKYLDKYPKKIKYHGIVRGKEKKKLLLKNYTFVLPSQDEGQPLSILEAYLNECYVITDPNIGGIKDIFEDEINGYKCKAKNIESILEALKKKKREFANYTLGIDKYKSNDFIGRVEKIIC